MILLSVLLLASAFMSIAVGASAIASAFGPVASSGSTNIMRSALLAGIAALFGAVLQGRKVTETIGGDILIGSMGVIQALIILTIASTLVIASVLTDYPMPTAFTVVGAVIGSGLGVGVRWSTVKTIVGFWILVPFLGVGIGYGLYFVIRYLVPKEENKKRIQTMTLLLGLLLAFTAGANSVGKAIGPLMGLNLNVTYLLIMGGVAMMFGSWLLSPRVINAISFDYSSIGPRRSMVALGTAALLSQVGTFLGVPISFAQAIIAAVIGSGLAVKGAEVGIKKIVFTAGAWTSAFLVAMGLAYGASLLFY